MIAPQTWQLGASPDQQILSARRRGETICVVLQNGHLKIFNSVLSNLPEIA
jgi:hypothetical protein